MIILFISECEHNAFKVSRRILNKYATQLGRRTWLARLSEEGLRDIYAELKSKVTRQMSVSCHRVRGKDRTSLEWIIGTRKHFNNEGVFAFSWTKRDRLQAVIEPTPIERAARYLTELAGLFHDLGKASAVFQAKLQKRASTGDPIRHEYVSWLMLHKLLGQAPDDLTWLEWLADYPNLHPRLEHAFAEGSYTYEAQFAQICRDIQNPPDDSLSMTHELPLPNRATTPLLHHLAWLVISHHRLPQGSPRRSKIVIRAGAHLHRNFSTDEIQACLQRMQDKKSLWAENIWWTQQVAAKATQLRNLLRSTPELNLAAATWTPFIAHYCRTMLMLGDHFVSKQNTQQCFPSADKKLIKSLYFANTNRAKGCMAATLNEHLRSVGKESGSLFRLGLRLADSLAGIEPSALPSHLHTIDKDTTTPFYWQDDACQKIKARHSDGIQTSGFFGVVLARTGAGKTRACARFMTQLSPRVRYNLALGLRTLTLQSGTAYRNELGLNKSQVSTLVGSELARHLHEMPMADSGSESAAVENLEADILDGTEEVDQDLPPQLAQLLATEPNKRLLLTAPILVSTVDYLVAAANPNRSRHLYASVRLMTSDLVLDEIDSYSEEDLIVLGKLVYLCGLFGRKVLLASATLPPALAETFFAAYWTGYQQYGARKHQEARLFAGWLTDQAALSRVEKCSSTEAFNRTHATVTQALVKQLQSEPAKRQAVLLDIPSHKLPTIRIHSHPSADLSVLFKTVLQQCYAFHAQQALIDPITNKRVSIGLVRWANTEACWRFAEYLLRHEPTDHQPEHRVLCYHAKLLPVIRYEVERNLDTLLQRKDATAFFHHPLVRDILDHNVTDDVMLVVSATPIEEIGRDHDFDWAIIEPSSTRAIIQTAGRVRRHRLASQNTQNIALLSTTVRGLKGENFAFRFPGVESEHYPVGSKQTATAYDLPLLQQAIDARALLNEAHSKGITTLEHRKLRDWLTGNTQRQRQDYLDLQTFIQQPDMALSDYHANHNRFRRSFSNLLYWFEEEDTWFCQSERQGKFEQVEVKPPRQEDIPTARYFAQWDAENLFETLQGQLYPDAATTLARQQLMGIESACYNAQDMNHVLRFHPLLGAYRLKP